MGESEIKIEVFLTSKEILTFPFTFRIVLETDSNVIVSRVSRLRTDTTDIPITEQTFIQVYNTARERVAERLLRGV
jgi:hypothetical protein